MLPPSPALVADRAGERLQRELLERCCLELCLESEVTAIRPDSVELSVGLNGSAQAHSIPNDNVFVMIGGVVSIKATNRSGSGSKNVGLIVGVTSVTIPVPVSTV